MGFLLDVVDCTKHVPVFSGTKGLPRSAGQGPLHVYPVAGHEAGEGTDSPIISAYNIMIYVCD